MQSSDNAVMDKMKVLIVDDEKLNQLLLSKIMDQLGYAWVIAEDGQDAVAQFELHQPDLVLMDVMMPRMNGHEATRVLKRLAGERWIPIIILSALSDQTQIVSGIKAGADDYLNKPLQLEVLKAKLRHFEIAINNQRQLQAQNRELRRYHFETEDEKRIASHLMRALVDVERMRQPGVEWWLEPADTFSGDVLAAAVTPDGKQHLMLADGTGHGLAAALSAQPLPDIFYAMTYRGFGIASIANEINRRVSRMLPIDRFFATTLVSIDPFARIMEVWNGGNPAPLLVDQSGQVLHVFPSRHLPLGIVRNRELSSDTERVSFPVNAQLLMMSDGLLTVFPQHPSPALSEALLAPPEARMQKIREMALEKLGDEKAGDDISLFIISTARLETTSQLENPVVIETVDEEAQSPSWSISLRLNGHQIKRQHQELLPMLMGFIGQLSSPEQKKATLFLVVSELFNNSLDHGLLNMDSQLKQQGFDVYLDRRAEKLNQLSANDHIEIRLDTVGSHLHISIKDTGSGFDHRSIMQRVADDQNFHGRGLALVRSLCSELNFSSSGNEISATLALAESV